MIKCDESMKRSKERCYSQENVRWTCTLVCDSCPCALHKRQDGTWEHTPMRYGHSHGKGEKNV